MKDNSQKKLASNDKKNLLDELLARESTDEMGLLDLIFIEEILKQKSLKTCQSRNS